MNQKMEGDMVDRHGRSLRKVEPEITQQEGITKEEIDRISEAAGERLARE